MVDTGAKIWMDGKFINKQDAVISVLTQSLHYGIGTFEGIRCYKLNTGGSAIFRLKDHIQRLCDGAHILNMDQPFSIDELIDAHIETVRINRMDECYIRPIMFSGDGDMGLAKFNDIHIAIAVWKWGAYLGEGALENGIRAKVSSFNRHHVNIGMVQGKINGQYVTSVLAKREAIAGGYDEAIMLDTQGYVAECSGENIFIVKDNTIYTAPINSPILPGITRQTIIKLAHDLNYTIKEERFTRDFMYLADDVFLTGTAAEVTPVYEIDDRQIGTGKPGPITLTLQNTYFQLIRGELDNHQNWLFHI